MRVLRAQEAGGGNTFEVSFRHGSRVPEKMPSWAPLVRMFTHTKWGFGWASRGCLNECGNKEGRIAYHHGLEYTGAEKAADRVSRFLSNQMVTVTSYFLN